MLEYCGDPHRGIAIFLAHRLFWEVYQLNTATNNHEFKYFDICIAFIPRLSRLRKFQIVQRTFEISAEMSTVGIGHIVCFAMC
jgi:hypothetical protein